MNRYFRTILLFTATTALPALGGCGSLPQMGDSKEALGAADALWTAITAKRSDLVEASADQLRRLKAAGKIPPDAAAAMDDIVERAAPGNGTRRNELRTFVKAQRRAA